MTDKDKDELGKALSSMSEEQIEQIEEWLRQNRKPEEKQEEVKQAEVKQVEKPKPRMCLCGVHEVQDGEYYCVFCKLKNPFLFR